MQVRVSLGLGFLDFWDHEIWILGHPDTDWCTCGNSFGKYGEAFGCFLPCLGDSTKICGGKSVNNVYQTT